jgi:hypothetical protein
MWWEIFFLYSGIWEKIWHLNMAQGNRSYMFGISESVPLMRWHVISFVKYARPVRKPLVAETAPPRWVSESPRSSKALAMFCHCFDKKGQRALEHRTPCAQGSRPTPVRPDDEHQRLVNSCLPATNGWLFPINYKASHNEFRVLILCVFETMQTNFIL